MDAEQAQREASHRMAAQFQKVADIYHRHGLPADVIAAVFFGAAVEASSGLSAVRAVMA